MRPTSFAGPVARRVSKPAVVIAGAAILLIAVTGCSDDQASSDGVLSGSNILQPGSPGEPASTLGPDAEVPETEWNDSDAAFMAMMIPHHAQALEMSELARTRAQSESVKALAQRISGAQGPEIIAMSAWLEARKLEVPAAEGDAHEHEHDDATMPGMLSEAEMSELAEARGADFDRLFLEGMIGHHQGAVQMAEEVATEGTDVLVSEMAADVGVGQSAEIDRMRTLLQELASSS